MINVIACGSITVTQVSAKGGSDIVTREIKRLSGRWRKRLNGEVNLLTWKGNKRRKKAKVVLLFWGEGGTEEKERRGINPAYENTGREQGGGGGGEVGEAGEKGRCACKWGSHPGCCCCRAGKQEPPCPERCPEISTAEEGEKAGGRNPRGVGVARSGGDQREACHVMSRRSGAHTGAAARPSAPAVPRLPPAPGSPRPPQRRSARGGPPGG